MRGEVSVGNRGKVSGWWYTTFPNPLCSCGRNCTCRLNGKDSGFAYHELCNYLDDDYERVCTCGLIGEESGCSTSRTMYLWINYEGLCIDTCWLTEEECVLVCWEWRSTYLWVESEGIWWGCEDLGVVQQAASNIRSDSAHLATTHVQRSTLALYTNQTWGKWYCLIMLNWLFETDNWTAY